MSQGHDHRVSHSVLLLSYSMNSAGAVTLGWGPEEGLDLEEVRRERSVVTWGLGSPWASGSDAGVGGETEGSLVDFCPLGLDGGDGGTLKQDSKIKQAGMEER